MGKTCVGPRFAIRVPLNSCLASHESLAMTLQSAPPLRFGESWVHPDHLIANTWNPNRMDEFMYAKELASITKFGFVNPIIVRSLGDQLEIIDGEHRARAAKELKLEKIPIWNLGELDDVTAKQLTLVLNETRGSADREQLSDLLRDLLTSETTQSLLDVLPYQIDDFKALLSLPDFDWDALETPTHEGSGEGWVERTYRFPPDAAKVLDQALARIKDGEGIPDWKALELMAADYLGGM